MRRTLPLLLAVFLVSTAALFARRALVEATPLAVAAWRLGLASLVFGGWSLASKQKNSPLTRAQTARLTLAGLCLAVHFLTWFAALQMTSVARATLLVCTTPLWTTLGALALNRQAVARVYWLALALAAFGVGLVARTAAEPVTLATARGDLLAVLGGVAFAGYLLAVEGLHETVSPRRQVTVAYSVAAALLWLALLTRGVPVLSYSPGVWLAILGMTLGPQLVGHTLLNASLRHFSSSIVAFSTLLEPVIAAALAFFLLDQTLTAGQICGGLLVLFALALVVRPQTPAEAVG